MPYKTPRSDTFWAPSHGPVPLQRPFPRHSVLCTLVKLALELTLDLAQILEKILGDIVKFLV